MSRQTQNNKQSNKRKGKRRRISSGRHRESFCACYISILKSKRNITIYVVWMCFLVVVVVVSIFFIKRHVFSRSLLFLFMVLSLFLLMLFLLFLLLPLNYTPANDSNNPRERRAGNFKFFVIACVLYHIFRFSSWWIFDVCRHCAVSAVAVRIFIAILFAWSAHCRF